MSLFASDGEAEVYHWARRYGVPDPAGFSINHAEHAGNESELRRLATNAERNHLLLRLAVLEQEKKDLDDSIRHVKDRLAVLNEERENDAT
ncbi:hypothetical protein IEJ02_11160 [Streptomyces sp. 5-10]|nr:hypothetical protein [Streptomyces sp. 5-10]